MQINYINVHYDKNSCYEFEDLNESLFIAKVIDQLHLVMGPDFFQYVFVIFSQIGDSVYPASIDLKSERKKVLIFISDESATDPVAFSAHYYAIFKVYMESTSLKNAFPLPVGYVKNVPHPEVKPINERSTNVFFRGNLNSNRINLYRNLSKFKYFLFPKPKWALRLYISFLLKLQKKFNSYFPNSIIIFNDGFKKGYSPEEYGKILSNSKIVLCPKGYDRTECFRHFEAMRAGCIIISEKLPETEFYLNSPIIEIDDWKEGLKIAGELITDPQKMEIMHRQTLSWWENKCSEKATAKYIFEKLLQLERHE